MLIMISSGSKSTVRAEALVNKLAQKLVNKLKLKQW